MNWENTSTDTLLEKKTFNVECATLPICMIFSSVGMILLKKAQLESSFAYLVSGYACDLFAFLIYPVSMKYFSLRVISVSWSASSTFTSLCVGYFLFDEQPSVVSLLGCFIVIIGIILVFL